MPPSAATIIQAGKLRHRVQIVQPTLAQDSFGGWAIDTVFLLRTVWASIEALSGRELFAAQQKVSEVTHRITIRWMDGVRAKQNIRFEDREFQIEAVENPDEIRKVLFLLCIEREDSAREGASAPVSGIVMAQPWMKAIVLANANQNYSLLGLMQAVDPGAPTNPHLLKLRFDVNAPANALLRVGNVDLSDTNYGDILVATDELEIHFGGALIQLNQIYLRANSAGRVVSVTAVG